MEVVLFTNLWVSKREALTETTIIAIINVYANKSSSLVRK